MTIGVSYIGINENENISVCEVGWTWAISIFAADNKKDKKTLREKLIKIFKEWHKDDKKCPKTIVKDNDEMIKKFHGDTYGIIKSNGIYLNFNRSNKKWEELLK